MKILVFGDIMGKIGRRAVTQALPGLRAEHGPDLILANAENLAHGKGITESTLKELLDAGIDLCTTGDHVWDRKEVFDVLAHRELGERLIRPANYPPNAPGRGSKLLTVGTKKVLVINLLGRVYTKTHGDDPFRTFDGILKDHAGSRPDVILVDFHAEATSEKIAFGWHVDGRASAVWGTHTHVTTRDERILPDGTAYITDIGMNGFRDGVLGLTKEPILKHFLSQMPVTHDIPETGEAEVNSLILEIGPDGKAISIKHDKKIFEIT